VSRNPARTPHSCTFLVCNNSQCLQAAFSPLQGSARMSTTRMRQTGQLSDLTEKQHLRTSAKHLPAPQTSLGGKDNPSPLFDDIPVMHQIHGPKHMLTELGNLSMDMHCQWLDAFSSCPIPSLVLSTTSDEPGVLLANTACVTALGRDSSTLGCKTLTDLIGYDLGTSCGKAAESGFEFIAPYCSIQVGHSMSCTSLFIPISDVCACGRPQCYLMLLLDSWALGLCKSALSTVPSHTAVQEVATAAGEGWRKGTFTQGNQAADSEPYNQAVGIVRGFAEAAQCRMTGLSLGMSMPSQFDVVGWISHFENLLTNISTP
jgi:hypothetical protein